MPSQAELIINASIAGGKKLATEPTLSDGSPTTGTGSIYDDKETLGMPGVASASNLKLMEDSGQVKVLQQQRIGGRGTTRYNPKREDKEVEAILGENIYNSKTEPDSKEQLIKKHQALESQYETLQAQVDLILAGVQGNPVAPKIDIDYNKMKWDDLRKFANSVGINIKGKKRPEIIEELNARSKTANG